MDSYWQLAPHLARSLAPRLPLRIAGEEADWPHWRLLPQPSGLYLQLQVGGLIPPLASKAPGFGQRKEFIPAAICNLQDAQLCTCGNVQLQPSRLPGTEDCAPSVTPVNNQCAELLGQGWMLATNPKPSKSFRTVILANSLGCHSEECWKPTAVTFVTSGLGT